MTSSTRTDITILGGGPTGLFAAFYAGLRNASCRIIDSMPELGGRLTAVYPEKFIYDVAGFPKILAKDLVDGLVAQAKAYNPLINLNEQVEGLKADSEGFILNTRNDKGETITHYTRTIIVAAGVGLYSPKKHGAAGAKDFEGNGIEYAVLEKNIYAGKRVVIAGGGDSALDWANELVALGAQVTLVHRSEKFRAHDDSVKKLYQTNARVLLNTEITSFNGNAKLESATILNNETSETEVLAIDAALIMFGFNSSLGRMKEWGLQTKGDCIVVNERMETSIPGIYAAGDITDYSGKLKLIVTGFSEAAIAANFAKSYINPKEKSQPMHSTTIMELKEKREARAAKV